MRRIAGVCGGSIYVSIPQSTDDCGQGGSRGSKRQPCCSTTRYRSGADLRGGTTVALALQAAELGAQVARCLVPIVGILFEAAMDDALHFDPNTEPARRQPSTVEQAL